MKVGCVKEVKKFEFRVGLTPDNAHEYNAHGHEVYIQSGAGEGSGYTDDEYTEAGAAVLPGAGDVWGACDMIVKVKEPLEEEYPFLRKGQIIFTYFHLAADKSLTETLLQCGVKAVAYETVTDPEGGLPLLKPMSEIAGRLSIQEGAKALEKPMGGMGILLGGVPGVSKAKVVVLGGGVVGFNACKVAVGFGADVTVFDVNIQKLTALDNYFDGKVQTLYSTSAVIKRYLANADLVIGAVLIPGGAAPKLIKREYLKLMKKGSVIVDVAVDQGGCCETSKQTYHDAPTYEVDGVVHYCVGNMPGAVSKTSTTALTNATLSYGLQIADKGLEKAVLENDGLARGVNCYNGALTCKEVAESFGMEYIPLLTAMR